METMFPSLRARRVLRKRRFHPAMRLRGFRPQNRVALWLKCLTIDWRKSRQKASTARYRFLAGSRWPARLWKA
jgi:hypothetical protein